MEFPRLLASVGIPGCWVVFELFAFALVLVGGLALDLDLVSSSRTLDFLPLSTGTLTVARSTALTMLGTLYRQIRV
jgi:hypothetical protein